MMFYIVILTDIPQMFPFRRYLDKSIDPIMSHFILPMLGEYNMLRRYIFFYLLWS